MLGLGNVIFAPEGENCFFDNISYDNLQGENYDLFFGFMIQHDWGKS